MPRKKAVARYSDKKRETVAYEWAASGNLSHVARITGVSRPTIRSWRDGDCAQWDGWVANARHQIGEEILAVQLTNARLAGDQLTDRIVNGDTRVMANGMTFNVPMSGKDLAVVNGIQVDKARTAMNMPNNVTSQDATISSLKAQFEALSQSHKRIEGTVVDEQ